MEEYFNINLLDEPLDLVDHEYKRYADKRLIKNKVKGGDDVGNDYIS